jgi:hypothetical protein
MTNSSNRFATQKAFNMRKISFAFLTIVLLLPAMLLGPSNAYAETATLVPSQTMPSTVDASKYMGSNALLLSFDLPSNLAPNSGSAARWGAFPQFSDASGFNAYIDGYNGNQQDWEIYSQQVIGNRSIFGIFFFFNGFYKVTFWAQLGDITYTYIWNVNVINAGGSMTAPPRNFISTSSEDGSQKNQVILTVHAPGVRVYWCSTLTSLQYRSFTDTNKPITDYYNNRAGPGSGCSPGFDAAGIARLPIDITSYFNEKPYLFVSWYEDNSYGPHPIFYTILPINVNFPLPKENASVTCEDVYRDVASKCTLNRSALDRLGNAVFSGQTASTTIEIQTSNGLSTKNLVGQYAVPITFYIGPDSQQETLKVKDATGNILATYTPTLHKYSVAESINIGLTLKCNLVESIEKCVAQNNVSPKAGFEMPISIPLQISTNIWDSASSTIVNRVIQEKDVPSNSEFSFMVNSSSNLKSISVKIDGNIPETEWVNPNFALPISPSNSQIQFNCPSNVSGSTIACTLRVQSESKSTAVLKISIEEKNSRNSWKSVKVVSAKLNTSSKIQIPNNLDSVLYVRASATINGVLLQSKISNWVAKSSSIPLPQQSTSSSGTRGSRDYLNWYQLMTNLGNSSPYPFTVARIQSFGGISGYCNYLESASENSTGVALTSQQRANFILACTDYLQQH